MAAPVLRQWPRIKSAADTTVEERPFKGRVKIKKENNSALPKASSKGKARRRPARITIARENGRCLLRAKQRIRSLKL